MKTKKTFIPIVTLCAALFLTACTGKDAATTEKPQDSQTEASTEATGDSSTTLDDLYQQENQIFADHEDVWNKAFGMMNKALPIQAEIMQIFWPAPLNQTRMLLPKTN